MDALFDILRVVRLSGAIFFHAEFTAPFSYEAARIEDLAPLVEPTSERLVIFHLIIEGECWIELSTGERVRLQAGDVALLPQSIKELYTAGFPPDPEMMKRLEWAVRDEKTDAFNNLWAEVKGT